MFNTAFSITKSRLKNRPVIKTYNLNDYSQADQYADVYKYVWLVNSEKEILTDFDWGWTPDENEEHLIHCFPECNPVFKFPVDWNTAKLVPTIRNSDTREKRQPVIAAYKTYQHTLYLYSPSDTTLMKKVKKFQNSGKIFKVITNYDSLNIALRKIDIKSANTNIWLIDANVVLDDNFSLDQDITDGHILNFKVKHLSNQNSYADGSVVAVTKETLQQILDGKEIKTKTVNTIAGINDDMFNPTRSWINAYSTTIKIEKEIIKVGRSKNKIYKDFEDVVGTRLKTYVNDGYITALNDLSDNNIVDIDSYKLMEIRFKQRTEEKQNEIAKIDMKTKIEKIKSKYV
jgi:hypothetical protein